MRLSSLHRGACLLTLLAVAACGPSEPVASTALKKPARSAGPGDPGPTAPATGTPTPAATGSTGTPTPAASGSTGTPTPGPTATTGATPTPSASGTATPAATATPTPAATGTATPTPVPTATPTPAPTAMPVTTLALQHQGTAAYYAGPGPFAADATGALYHSDPGTNVIHRFTAAGADAVYAGSGAPGAVNAMGALDAQFNAPTGLAVGGDGTLYVSEAGNHRIRAIAAGGGLVTTYAGSGQGNADGPAASALFNTPQGLAIDPSTPGSPRLYVADRGNHCIRLIDHLTVSTFAGATDGTPGTADGADARFNQPSGLLLSPDRQTLYVYDGGNHRIRAVDVATRAVTTLAGTTSGYRDAGGDQAMFSLATSGDLALLPDGGLLVPDAGNHRLRRVDLGSPDHAVTTYAGAGTPGEADGSLLGATFNFPGHVLVTGGKLYVSEGQAVRVVTTP